MIVCVQTSNKEPQARALSASLSLSLPTKAVHTMVFQGTSIAIHTTLHPTRPHFLPALTTPGNILLAHEIRSRRPRWPYRTVSGFFSASTVLASAPRCDRSLRRGSGGSLGTYLFPVKVSRQDSSKLFMRHARAELRLYTQEKIRPRTTGRWIHI